jgi:hypothetical protein
MTATNYLALVINRDVRVRNRLTPTDLVFPFDDRDARTITAASNAAAKMQSRLDGLGTGVLAVYAPCDMLEDLPSVMDADEIRYLRIRASHPAPYSKRYPNGTPYGFRNSGRAA